MGTGTVRKMPTMLQGVEFKLFFHIIIYYWG
jgi:hypothetical protein